jgi:hypothetical protein
VPNLFGKVLIALALYPKCVENIENVNKVLKAAHSWHDKVDVPALV